MNRIIIFSLLILSLMPNNSVILQTDEPLSIDSPDILEPQLTWTSRWDTSPRMVENHSELMGDHVVLNASFPESYNITKTEMRVWNGFTYTTTRQLVIPADPGGAFEGLINHTDLDWVTIKGIEKGWLVNITCNFTNGDCDFMGWDSTIEPAEYSYWNNLLDMASGDKPETDSFYWTSENDTLVVACLNYDATPGNWTLLLQVGRDQLVSTNSSSVIFDTYYLERNNQTYNIEMTGYSDTTSSYQVIREDVRISNFFEPVVTIQSLTPLPEDEHTLNISWSIMDLNANDTHYYAVFLSNNEGVSFYLFALNLTQRWWLWDSRGYLSDWYIVKIRAYNLDFTSELCGVNDPPESYWPGTYGESYAHSFFLYSVGGFYIPSYRLAVNSPSDISYYEGSQGNVIIWTFVAEFGEDIPDYTPYRIYLNGTLLNDTTQYFLTSSMTLTFNVDGFEAGLYHFRLSVMYPDSDISMIYDLVTLTVLSVEDTNTTTTTSTSTSSLQNEFLQILLYGISWISIAVIVTVVSLIIRLRRQHRVSAA